MKRQLQTLLVFGVTAAALVYDPLATAAHPKRFVALLASFAALAALLGARTRRIRPPLERSLGGTAWLLFVLWSSLSILWGRPVGLDVALAWIAGAGVIVAAGALSAQRVQSATLCSGWWIGTISSVVVVAQWASGIRGIALHGTQGNGNWLGLLLAMTLPLSAGLVAEGKKRGAWWWMAGLMGVVLQLPALALAGSRVAWVAVAAACVVALGVGVPRRPLLVKGMAVLSLGGAMALLSSVSVARAVSAEEETIVAGARESLGGRTWIWSASLQAAQSALPCGTGLGGFGHAYLEAQGRALRKLPVPEASRRFHNATTAHQDWIQALVETGPVGLALLILCIASGWAAHARARAWASVGALTGFVACACGDSPLRQPAAVLLLCMLLASAPRRGSLRPLPVLAIGLVLTSLAMAPALAGWLASRWETHAREALLDSRTALLERAIRIDGRSGRASLLLGLTRLELADSQGALPQLKRSRERLANVGTDIALGNAWMAADDAVRAERSYRRALALHPGSFRGHANLAESLRMQGKFDEAGRQLTLAKRLYPGHPKIPEIEERLRRDVLDRDTGDGNRSDEVP